MPAAEPRNPFYALLMVSSVLFVGTVLGVAVIPVLEQKATEAGEPPPPSAWRDAVREQGVVWLLYEVAAMVVFGLASMALDRYRRLQAEQQAAATSVSRAEFNSPSAPPSE
jgi:hypothetical protein